MTVKLDEATSRRRRRSVSVETVALLIARGDWRRRWLEVAARKLVLKQRGRVRARRPVALPHRSVLFQLNDADELVHPPPPLVHSAQDVLFDCEFAVRQNRRARLGAYKGQARRVVAPDVKEALVEVAHETVHCGRKGRGAGRGRAERERGGRVRSWSADTNALLWRGEERVERA